MKQILTKLIECQKLTFEESHNLMHGIANKRVSSGTHRSGCKGKPE